MSRYRGMGVSQLVTELLHLTRKDSGISTKLHADVREVASEMADRLRNGNDVGDLVLKLQRLLPDEGNDAMWVARFREIASELSFVPRQRLPPPAPPPRSSDTQLAIVVECDEMKAFLLEKNRKYGDSALAPKRVFSHADPVEQLRVRIDDKLSRIAFMGDGAAPDEDTVKDLIGYLMLLRIAMKRGSDPTQTKVEV